MEATYLTFTPFIYSKGLKSVKFDILGSLITAISINEPELLLLNLSVKLSSSSILTFK